MIAAPAASAAAARRWLAGELPAATPRDAAAVALVRDIEDGLEVLMLARAPTMSFAPEVYVFPGGSVTESDRAGPTKRLGALPPSWHQSLDATPGLAHALFCAAVRETFEECGILLAQAGQAASALDGDGVRQAERASLEERRGSLADLCDKYSIRLSPGFLAPLAHWLTPAGAPRRDDTRFFVARLPPGQNPALPSAEAVEITWLAPAAAVAGEYPILPPTRAVLSELATYKTARDAMRAPRAIRRITPKYTDIDGQIYLLFPGDEGYPPPG